MRRHAAGGQPDELCCLLAVTFSLALAEQMSGQPRRQQHAVAHRRPQVAMRAAAETIPTGETDVAEGDTYEVNNAARATGLWLNVGFGLSFVMFQLHTQWGA